MSSYPLSLRFLKRMTTPIGIVQHSRYNVPDWKHGYCLDDNGRALALMVRYMENHYAEASEVKDLAATYLSYVAFAERPDGWMNNFMSHDLKFKEEIGSADSFGRALWGLGEASVCAADSEMAQLSESLLLKYYSKVVQLGSSRAKAYSACGLVRYWEKHQDQKEIKNLLEDLEQDLLQKYQKNNTDDWHWFENSLTYSNALLCLALLEIGQALNHKESVNCALESFNWLLSQTESKRGDITIAAPVGHEGWFLKGSKKSEWGQQPIDVALTILMASRAFEVSNDRKWLAVMERWYGWFEGKNSTDTNMINNDEGWCYDGLYSDHVNPNHGAETVIMFLMAQLEMKKHFSS